MHDGPGGVAHTTQDLAASLVNIFGCWFLLADPHRLRLFQLDRFGGEDLVDEWWLTRPWSATRLASREHRLIYDAVLDRVAPYVVHVRHLLAGTLDLFDACRQRRLGTIMSLHDYYAVCPSIHLIDDRGVHCGGLCTPSIGQCSLPISWLCDLPRLKGDFISSWRSTMATTLSSVDALVTTSPSVRDLYLRVFPDLDYDRIEIIEHGRDFSTPSPRALPPEPGGPVRILIPGHLGPHKGSRFIRKLWLCDAARERRLQFDFLGTIDDELHGIGAYHGHYKRDQLAQWCNKIQPSFVGIFSPWPETYSHVLSEAWALGIPVLTSGLGALGDRIGAHGGGWVVPVHDPPAAYRRILEVADDPKSYSIELARIASVSIPSMADMATSYRRLYNRVAENGSENSAD